MASADTSHPDLTTLGIFNGKRVSEGVLSAGQPTEEQVAAAAALGVKTLVNLRGEGERGDYDAVDRKAAALGMEVVHIPISGGDGLTAANAEKLAAVVDQAHQPVIVHCKSGQRVGALFAVKAGRVDGKSADEALAIGASAGLSMPGMIDAVKAQLAAK